MSKRIKKTNAMRILDTQGISYEVTSYPADEDHLDGVTVSQSIGIPAKQVFKTLVTMGEGETIVCLIPVAETLDLKGLAARAGIKKLDMVPVKDIEKLTGYQRGGCSPIGMRREFPTYLDESALQEETIVISAGAIGWQIILKPQQLMELLDITVGNFTME